MTNGASRCRWAAPTLFQQPPIWLEAWDSPWTCKRNEDPRVLEDTEPCDTCPRREPPGTGLRPVR